eukprot:Rhum_TRINITY_DN8525_c0_g1::Rhum_TRINITY_DN8525_c0_g1_i1::g.28545::m.28545
MNPLRGSGAEGCERGPLGVLALLPRFLGLLEARDFGLRTPASAAVLTRAFGGDATPWGARGFAFNAEDFVFGAVPADFFSFGDILALPGEPGGVFGPPVLGGIVRHTLAWQQVLDAASLAWVTRCRVALQRT